MHINSVNSLMLILDIDSYILPRDKSTSYKISGVASSWNLASCN